MSYLKFAQLLNISLPYDSAYLTINNALISPIQRTLPQIYANQVLLDIPVADLSSVISSDQLEGSHSAGGFFGLSYRHSLRFLKDTPAFLFQFDILEIWSDLPETPILHKVNSADQKMLEVILIEKPLISALSSSGFEILKAELVPRSRHPVAPTSPQQTMYFLDWDSNGRKGTAAHALTAFGFWFLDFLDQGLWAMFTFIAGVIALFIVACVFCTFGWGFWRGDYEKAQHGKKRRKTDVEAAARMPFKSAEQLGFSRGRVIGIGKGD